MHINICISRHTCMYTHKHAHIHTYMCAVCLLPLQGTLCLGSQICLPFQLCLFLFKPEYDTRNIPILELIPLGNWNEMNY